MPIGISDRLNSHPMTKQKDIVVSEFETPHFPVRLLRSSEKFNGGLAPMQNGYSIIHDRGGYFAKKKLDTNRRYDRSLLDTTETFDKYKLYLTSHLAKFEPLFTDYDKKVILPNTCALSMQKPAHTDFESLGYIGMDNDYTYPDDLTASVVKFYQSFLVPEDSGFKISMPRGKNIGYPFPISGRNRDLSDVLLALSTALCLGTDKNGIKYLKDVYALLEPFHGPAFTVQGERYQHTGKEQPIVVKDGIFSSNNFEPRVRIICMSSKISVIKDRKRTKRLLMTLLNTPQHVQDRKVIQGRISKMEASFKTVIAVDMAKFDFRAGGKRGKQIVKMMSDIISDPVFYDNVITDFDTKMILFGYRECFTTQGDRMLKSGMGTTTLIGCIANFTTAVGVVATLKKISFAEAIAQYQKTWDGLFWGDDSVLALRDNYDLSEIQKAYATYHMEIDDEPNLKYLGVSYGRGTFVGTMDLGYSLGRAFQQQFLPERMKDFPFSTVGYIARLDLMGPRGADFHKLLLSSWPEDKLGVPFKYEDRKKILTLLLPEIEKHADKISQLDDVLNLFTHGIQDIDPSLVDIDSDMMEILGNQGFADVSDPARFLETKTKVPDMLISNIRRLSAGDISVYPKLLADLQRTYNLQWTKGSVVY
jgi:hypothetical protein